MKTSQSNGRHHVEPEKSYLDRLTYSPSLNQSWVAKYVTNFRLVSLLLVTILLLGTASYFRLPQRLNPELKIPIVVVTSILPGASPEDVETLLTVPLENEISSVKGIDQVNSTSRESASIIVIQFFSGTDPEKAKNEVQSAIDSALGDLPEDAQDPTVAALDFEDQPIWSFVLKSRTGNDLASLMNFSQNLKESLEDMPEVDRVATTGFETQEISVNISPEKVTEYGLNPLMLSDQINKGVLSYPAGTVNTSAHTYSFTIDPGINSAQDIRQLKINTPGGIVSLGDIADVTEESKSEQNQAFLVRGAGTAERIVTFYVFKTSGVNINEAGEAVEDKVDSSLAPYSEQFELVSIQNTAEEITNQFTDLLKEFRSTVILVFLCLFLFLGLRQALISSLTVPLTFLSAFIIMNLVGMSINFLSLFAFLLSLGLLVDDTIVVVSAMTRYYRTGKFTPHQTGVLVWRDTIVPIWSTTITTIWSFAPLLLSTGIIGEFIKPIPIVVTATMVSSTGIAVLITLPLMIVLLKPNLPKRVVIMFQVLLLLAGFGALALVMPRNIWLAVGALVYLLLVGVYSLVKHSLWSRIKVNSPRSSQWMGRINRYANRGVIDIEVLAGKYYRLMTRILESRSARRKVVIAIVAYSLLAFLLLPLGLVTNEFFPKQDTELLYVNLEMPAGTNLATSKQAGMKLLEHFQQTPGIEYVVVETGKNLNLEGGSDEGSNLVQFTLHLPEDEHREIGSIQLAENLRATLRNYPQGTVSVVELSGGPPAGADLQIRLLGDDLGVLNQEADEIVAYLGQQPGVTNPRKSVLPGTSKLVFVPDPQRLAEEGVSRDAIGIWMRLFASDLTLDTINFDKTSQEKQDVVFTLGETPTPERISELMVPTNRGSSVPLLSLGKLKAAVNPTSISREDYKRTLAVSAGVSYGYSISNLNTSLVEFVQDMDLPPGYSWATGGVNEENQRSVNSILQAMGLAFILILVTMVIQFNSFRQALIVLMVIPLAVSSVFIAFGLTGTPLSFPSLIGILSLFGIVVTNSMFIVDKINLNLREGMPFTQSVANAGSSRLEPIVLTKLATILGLLPITIADPLWRGLGGAIISGILIASTIMLFFIPVVYYQWFAPRENR